jgi:diadenosine tetraphosphate (Ap4A) HIT family hydrolase
LCQADGGLLVARLDRCRVIRAQEPGFPALYRVVWNDHVAEWSDLSEADQIEAMRVVNIVERALREHLHPTKINLAALGNVVPHLHWHVIARFDWDSHFPAPIWGQAQRTVEPGQLSVLEHLMPRVDEVLRQRLLPW